MTTEGAAPARQGERNTPLLRTMAKSTTSMIIAQRAESFSAVLVRHWRLAEKNVIHG
jgi:hypothetical protein